MNLADWKPRRERGFLSAETGRFTFRQPEASLLWFRFETALLWWDVKTTSLETVPGLSKLRFGDAGERERAKTPFYTHSHCEAATKAGQQLKKMHV